MSEKSMVPGTGMLDWPVQYWADPAKRYGNEAGVDPSFLLAVTLMESRKARSLYKLAGESGFADIGHAEAYSWYHGTWIGPSEGPSLGITNVKPGVFDTVAKAFPGQFKGQEWSDLAGNDDLSIKVTAYYLKYLQNKYANASAPRLSKTSSTQASANEMLYGVYNGGENQFATSQSNGYFGPVVSGNISKMDTYLPWAQRLIGASGGSVT
jgi:soluble lytic murein transglycosylase-like protein